MAAARRFSRQQGSSPASDAGGVLAARRTSQQQGEAAAAALAQRRLDRLGSQGKVPEVGSTLALQVDRQWQGCDRLHHPTHGGQAAHSSGPPCRSLEGKALIRLHQPVIQTMRPGHRLRARQPHPVERRWSLHSWQVSCCQAGCIRAAYGNGYTGLHEEGQEVSCLHLAAASLKAALNSTLRAGCCRAHCTRAAMADSLQGRHELEFTTAGQRCSRR